MKRVAKVLIAVLVTVTSLITIVNLSTMKELKTEIILNASPEKVWNVLTNFEAYKNWNPFIVSSSGQLKKGAQLTNTMMHGGKKNVFKPVITKVNPNKEFEWLGTGFVGMFKGRHYFILEDLGNGQCKLIHGEKFSGLLSGPIMKMIGEETLQNFQKMNQALQSQVETP